MDTAAAMAVLEHAIMWESCRPLFAPMKLWMPFRDRFRGLVGMDSPGREPEILTGLAAAGCNVIAFTTGRGAPQSFPFVHVVKITGNRVTWNKLRDHMDVDVSAVIEGKESLPEAGKRIFREILDVLAVETIDGLLMKKVFGIKYVKVDIEEDGKSAHFKMPSGEMKQELSTGPDGGPVRLENQSLPFLSNVKACHSFFWNFADYGRHFDYKDRCGTWADFAFTG
jgi:hypothetical protein